jgi:hypothetical protein
LCCCYYCHLPWTSVLQIRHKVIILLSPPPTIDSESIVKLFNSCIAQHLRFTTPPNWQSPSNLPFLLLPSLVDDGMLNYCCCWLLRTMLLLHTTTTICELTYSQHCELLLLLQWATGKLKGLHPRSTNKQPRR